MDGRAGQVMEGEAQADWALRTSGLRRSFGNLAAVDGLDVNVREGEIYGFLGVNGAGKTTTIRMLMGIVAPDGGEIELMGKRSARTTRKQKQRIGYVSQEPVFYPWMTALGLGRFVGGLYPTWDKKEFVRLLGVLEVPAKRRVSALSGGMKVKLGLALALASRPPLLILDEPTAGLDPVARREFLEIITHQAREYGRTTFFSTHLLDEVERAADRVGIIHQGKMRYEGRLDVLRERVRTVRLRAGSLELAVPRVPPVGAKVWKDEPDGEGGRVMVIEAEPAVWAVAKWPEGAVVETMALDDIFIACVGISLAQL